MSWTVKIARDAAKQLEAIPPDRRGRILDDIRALGEGPFRGLVRPLKVRDRKVSGRYRIILKHSHTTSSVELLLVFLRNERTYR